MDHSILAIAYIGVTLFTVLSFNQLNLGSGKDGPKINFWDKLKFIIISFCGFIVLLNFLKIYLLLGMSLASLVAIMATVNFNIDPEIQIKELSIGSTLMLCLFSVLFWVQVVSFNFFVLKRFKVTL